MKSSWIPVLIGGLVVGGLAGFGIGMSRGGAKSAGDALTGQDAAPTCSADGGAPTADGLFELDNKVYRRGDLPENLRAELYEVEHEAHERLSGVIKTFAVQLALAQAKDPKASPANLPPLESLLSAANVTDAQAKEFFEKNKNRMPPDAKFDDIKDRLKAYMGNEARGEQLRTKLAELEGKGKLKVLVKEPEAPTVNIDTKNYPSHGPQDAKVTLIEVSDYQCSHCIRTQPEIDALIKSHGDKFKFVQINYALNPTGLSGALARGAYCANKEGSDKFWTYHSAAFQVKPEEKAEEALKRLAGVAGLDAAKLATCANSEEAKAFVAQTGKAMNDVGIRGTPTFILNNKRLAHGSITELVKAALK
jgi:protein-disulfide isomerase